MANNKFLPMLKEKIILLQNIVKNNKLELFLALCLFLVAAFFRFYQIGNLDFFTYDQARDALFIKRIIVDHKLRLIGTQSSIPGLYTGPAYYYLMAPFLLIFNLSPIGIDFGTALVSLLSVLMLYFLIKSFTGKYFLGILLGFLYAVQPQILSQSKFGWNPNMTPFWVLIFIFSIHKLLSGSKLYWLGIFISLAMVLQLHYSGMCLIPALIIIIFLFRNKIKFGKWFFVSFITFFVLMSPLVFFDLRHDFVNIKAVLNYLFEGPKVGIVPPPFTWGVFDKTRYLLIELIFGIKNYSISLAGILFISIFSIFAFFKKTTSREGLIVIWTILSLGIITASLYKGSFFNFYLTFLYPLGFLILGILLKTIWELRPVKVIITLSIMVLIFYNLKASAVSLKRNDLVPNFINVTSVIALDIKNDSHLINLVRIGGADRFDYNAVDYKYFLETFQNKKVLDWDVLDYQKAEILYLISHEGEVDPLALNVWEINLFSPKEVVNKWKVSDMIWVYKLIK